MIVLLDADPGGLTLRRVRPWHLVLARVLAARLDRQLADGADPEEHARLAARAMQLTSARSRRDLAASLLRLRSAATGIPAPPRAVRPGPGKLPPGPRMAPSGPGLVMPGLPVRRERISRAAPELAEVASRLLAPVPAPARGVALVRQLLTDGAGPLYGLAPREDLRAAARRAAEALAA